MRDGRRDERHRRFAAQIEAFYRAW